MSLLFTVDEDETRALKCTDSSVDSNHSNNSSVKKKLKVKSKLFTDESAGDIKKPRKIYDVHSSDEEGIYFKKKKYQYFFIPIEYI